MSLSALAWRKLPVQTLAASAVADVLDAIFTAFGSATYYDGTTRTIGAGSAHSVSKYTDSTTEAVYGACFAVPGDDSFTTKWIMCGEAGALKSPTLATPDADAAATIFTGINKNSGAFLQWNSATPFTSGGFSGCWRGLSSGTYTKVHCYEATEAIAVFAESSVNDLYCLGIVGALWDPNSTSNPDAETNGRLYGMITMGKGIQAPGTYDFHTATATPNSNSNAFLRHDNGTDGNAHGGYFEPGSNTWQRCFPAQEIFNGSSTTRYKTASGRFAQVELHGARFAAAPNDYQIGRLREIVPYVSALGATKHSDTTDVAYIIAGDTATINANQGSIGLLYS